MLNHKHNACKSKSKILLLALCIFGLVFSYSCNCINNSTAPDEYTPKTYEAEKTIGSALIVVKSDGSSITPANISFKDATVTSVVVDAGTTGIAADAFKYENGNLTMTAFDSVTSTSRQKVTATFSLAPSDSRYNLTNPTETVEIEVVKATAIDKKTLGDKVKSAIDVQEGQTVLFQGYAPDSVTVTDTQVTIKNSSPNKDSIPKDYKISAGTIKGKLLDNFKGEKNTAELKKWFSNISIEDKVTGLNTQKVVYTVSFTPYPEYEFDNTYKIELDLISVNGSWVQ